MNVLFPQTVFVAVLHIAFAGVNHKNAGTLCGILFIQHQDTGRNSRAIEQVSRQPNNAFDITSVNDLFADVSLSITTEQHAMGQNDCCLAGRFQRFQDMQQPSIVAVFLRRHAQHSFAVSPIRIRDRNAIHPGFIRERRIDYDVVEGFQQFRVVLIFILGCRQGAFIADNDTSTFIMQNQVHASQTGSGIVLFLSIDRELARSLIRCTNQQRTGTASRIVDRHAGIGGFINADYLCHDTRDFSRCVELALALAGILGKFPHQKLVGVAQNVITASAVIGEVQLWLLENLHKAGKLIYRFFVGAQFLAVKVGNVDNAFQVVGFCQLANDDIDAFTNVFLIFQRSNIVKTTAFRYFNVPVIAALEAVGHILYKQ